MKNTLILVALAFSLSTAKAELTASHQAAIERLLEVLQVQKQMETNLVAGLETGMGASSEQIKLLPKEKQEQFLRAFEKVKAVLVESMGWEKLKPDIVEIYGKNFSEKEATDISAHMSTPAGQKFVTTQMTLAADMMKISQERMKTLTPQIVEIMKAEMSK